MAKIGLKMQVLIAHGITNNDEFWKGLQNELDTYFNSKEKEEAPTIDSSEFSLTQDGIAAAVKVLNDPYATPNRKNAATDFLITAHEKGMYK